MQTRAIPANLSLFGWLRIALRLLAMAVVLVLALPVHYVWRLVAYGSPIPMLYLRFTGWTIGARRKVHGTPLRHDAFCLANHTSWLDIMLLAGTTGTAFVAKAELKKNPFVAWLCSLNRTIFVDRGKRGNIDEQLNSIREAMKDNWSITVFPEGTTTDNQTLLPFKSSLLAALYPPVPGERLQSIFVDYGAMGEEIGWVGDEPASHNILKVLGRKGSFPVAIHYLPSFDPADYKGRKQVAEFARGQIGQAMAQARGEPQTET